MSKGYWRSTTKGRIYPTTLLETNQILANMDFMIFKNEGIQIEYDTYLVSMQNMHSLL